MMMSKPSSDGTEATATTATATTAANGKVKPPTPLDAVADLERRLKELSSATPHIPPVEPAATTTTTFAVAPPPAAPAPAAPATAAAASTNKNALLARIMAAQERAKQQSNSATTLPVSSSVTTTTTTTAPDVWGSATAPPVVLDAFVGAAAPLTPWETAPMAAPPPPPPSFAMVPPPAFDETNNWMVSPPPPPSFNVASLPPPPPPPQQQPVYMQWDPHASASAPALEDLWDNQQHHHHHPPAMMPPPMAAPPVSTTPADDVGLDDEALAMILGMEGLTAAEKQEMINEQRKIFKSIEDSKKTSQMSAADAFEQRSFSAAVQGMGGGSNNNRTSNMQLNGQERTREAIADGTAVMVQCTACTNWMQVTGSAQLMFCPVCQTVSPVQGSGLTAEEAQQMADDAKLAEQLQNEEYEESDRNNTSGNPSGGRSPSRTMGGSSSRPSTTTAAAPTAATGSWMEWLGFGTPAPAPTHTSAAATTGSPMIRSSASRDSDEGDGLLSGAATGRARVATSQPLFACVTDSIHSAANYAMNGVQEDDEGNVHGVDSSSLLAVTQVGRGGGGNDSNQRYEPLPDPS